MKPDREKVMRGLEAHSRPTCETCDGQECPYYRINTEHNVFSCSVFLASDALSLLKEQEARVMTLEELQAIETPWNRNTPPYLFVEGRSSTEAHWMSWGFLHDCVRLPGTMGVRNYGSKWRVWNLQPTPEQMRDTPWEGEDNG